jgi:hypothetical protein
MFQIPPLFFVSGPSALFEQVRVSFGRYPQPNKKAESPRWLYAAACGNPAVFASCNGLDLSKDPWFSVPRSREGWFLFLIEGGIVDPR